MYFTITLKVVDKFPTNLAHSLATNAYLQMLSMCHKKIHSHPIELYRTKFNYWYRPMMYKRFFKSSMNDAIYCKKYLFAFKMTIFAYFSVSCSGG